MIVLAVVVCMFCAILAFLYWSKKRNRRLVPARNYREGAEDICNISACCDPTATAVDVPGETIQLQAVQTAPSTILDDDQIGPKPEITEVETLEKAVVEETISECSSVPSFENPDEELAEAGIDADDESPSLIMPGPSLLKPKSQPKLSKEERRRRPRTCFASGIEGGLFQIESECKEAYRWFRAQEEHRAQEALQNRVSSNLADLDFSGMDKKVMEAIADRVDTLHLDDTATLDAVLVSFVTGTRLKLSPKGFTLPRFGFHLNLTRRPLVVQTFAEARRNLEAILEEAMMGEAAIGRGYEMKLDSEGRVLLSKPEYVPVRHDVSIFPITLDTRNLPIITWYLSDLVEYFPLRSALALRWPKCKVNHIDAFISRVLEVGSDEASEALSQFRPYLKDPEEDLTLLELAIKIFEELFIQEAAEGRLAVQLRIHEGRLCWFKKDPHFRQSHVAVTEDEPAYVPIRRPGEFLMRMSLMRQGLLNMINTENDLLVAPSSGDLDTNNEDVNRFSLHQCKSPYIEVNPHIPRDTSMWEGCALSSVVPEMAFFGLPAPQQIHMAYELRQAGQLHQLTERSLLWRRALVEAGKVLVLGQAAKQGLLDLSQGSGQLLDLTQSGAQLLDLSQNGTQPLTCVQDSVIVDQDDTSSLSLTQVASAVMDLGQSGPSDPEELGLRQEADQDDVCMLDLGQSGPHHSSEPVQDTAPFISDLVQSGLRHSSVLDQDNVPFISDLVQSGLPEPAQDEATFILDLAQSVLHHSSESALHHSSESAQDDAVFILDLDQSGLPHSLELAQDEATFILDLDQSGAYHSSESAQDNAPFISEAQSGLPEPAQDEATFILDLVQSGLPKPAEDEARFILDFDQSGAYHLSESAQDNAPFISDLETVLHHSSESALHHSSESAQDDAVFILDLDQSGLPHSLELAQDEATFILDLDQSGAYHSSESAQDNAPFISDLAQSGLHHASEPAQNATHIMNLDQPRLLQTLEHAQDATNIMDLDQSGHQLLELAQDAAKLLDSDQPGYQLLDLAQDSTPFLDLHQSDHESLDLVQDDIPPSACSQNTHALNKEMKQTVMAQGLKMKMKQTVLVVNGDATEAVDVLVKSVPIGSAIPKVYMNKSPEVADPTVNPMSLSRSGVRMSKADSETLSLVSNGEVRAVHTCVSITQNSTVTRNQLASEKHRLRMEKGRRDKSVLKEKTGATPSSSLSTPRLTSRPRLH